jgi:tetratricopeptide (TPR) repeat protein
LSWTYRDYYRLPLEAAIYADKQIIKYPDIITGYYNKGRALEAEKKYDAAVVEYMRALESNIQSEYYQAETNEHLALIQNALGKKDLAAEFASKALEIHTQYWIPDHLEGRIQTLEKIRDKVE